MPLVSLCQPATLGCNTADEPVQIDRQNSGRYLRLTGNMRIHNNRWRTAYRWRELQGHGADLELWQAGHTQNAIWYLPQSGQGTKYLTPGMPRIVDSTAGRLFTLTPNAGFFEVKDVSGGNTSYPNMMLAWLAKGENYVIRTDGRSQTQIWDGTNPVQFSPGYSTIEHASRFPNGAGPTVYAGNRFWTTLFDRRLYVSDSLHQTNQTNASDLLRFTDQTYDYLDIYFAPPAEDGDIVALCVSIDAGNRDSRAQNEVLSMCSGPSIWGVPMGVPREQWPTAQMRHSRSKETAATGPNAFHVRDGDILMRSSKGIESLNLLARERNTLGNPSIDLGADMKSILQRDDEALLLFASLCNPQTWNRMLCTVTPQISGARHWHLGWISANWNPLGTRIPQGYAWEGLGTLPRSMGRIVQFLPARIDGHSRVFAILDKDATSKGLAEATKEEGHNILADGTHVPIEQFFETRRLTTAGDLSPTDISAAWIYLDDIKTDLDVSVHVRTSTKPEYQLCRQFHVERQAHCEDPTGCGSTGDMIVHLGNILESKSRGHRWVQILVKMKGVATLDMILRTGDQSETPPDAIENRECFTIETEPPRRFDPYFYALA